MSGQNIELTHQQLEKIRLLSDGQLYRDALDFIEAQGTIDGRTQLASLISYTQSWTDLTGFVRHQSQRDWIGKKSYYGQFYTALDSYLKQLYQQVLKEFPLPDNYETKAQKRNWNEHCAIRVAREFVEHLTFENLYREKQR